MSAHKTHWLFRFSLRTFLLVAILGAIITGLTVSKMRQARCQRELLAALQGEGVAYFDWERVDLEARRYPDRHILSQRPLGGEPPGPAWLRRRLGDAYFQEVTDVNVSISGMCYSIIPVVGAPNGKATANTLPQQTTGKVDNADAVFMESLFRFAGRVPSIRRLYCARRTIDDPSMAPLRHLKNLEELDLSGTGISGEGLHYLASMRRLKWLSLSFTGVSDSDLFYLRKLHSLEHLDLSGTSIVGRRLHYLAGLPNLKRLKLNGTRLGDHLHQLAQLTPLEELDLSYLDFDVLHPAVKVDFVERLPNLKSLRLCRVRLEHGESLVNHPALESLDLSNAAVYEFDLKKIGTIASLKELNLTGCKSITIDGVRALVVSDSRPRVWLGQTKVTVRQLLELQHEFPDADFSRFGRYPTSSISGDFQPMIGPADRLPDGWRPDSPAHSDPNADPFADGNPFGD